MITGPRHHLGYRGAMFLLRGILGGFVPSEGIAPGFFFLDLFRDEKTYIDFAPMFHYVFFMFSTHNPSRDLRKNGKLANCVLKAAIQLHSARLLLSKPGTNKVLRFCAAVFCCNLCRRIRWNVLYIGQRVWKQFEIGKNSECLTTFQHTTTKKTKHHFFFLILYIFLYQ